MADLHRYNIKMQYFRNVNIDALNESHAKQLGEDDTALAGGMVTNKATTATLIQSDVGEEGGQPLHRYDVRLKVRRDVVVDAEDFGDAENWATQDIDSFGGAVSKQRQQVRMLRQKTGVTG